MQVVVLSLPPHFINYMKKYIYLFCSLLFISACSHNKQDDQQITRLNAMIDSLTTSLAQQDSLFQKKYSELEANSIFLENKLDLMDQQISFYSDRIDTILDIISNNTRNINALQGIKTPPVSSPSPQVKSKGPQDLYAQARKLYLANQLNNAKDLFNDFIIAYPSHELAINSKYWLAEIDYDQEKYQAAIDKFTLISQDKTNPEKAIDSLFKIALINKILGNYDLSLRQAQAILHKNPNYIRINKVKSLIKDLN